MKATIYFNSRCSKARGAHALLLEKGFTVETIDYLKQPLSKGELQDLQQRLGVDVRTLIRSGEAEYTSQNLGDGSLSDDALLEAIIACPKLLQRPIVIVGDQAVIARPPERLLEIIP